MAIQKEGGSVPVFADSPVKDSLQSRLNKAVKAVVEAEQALRAARVAERVARLAVANAEAYDGA